MLIYVDIDETICRYEDRREYPLAIPIEENIHKINQLFDQGQSLLVDGGWSIKGL